MIMITCEKGGGNKEKRQQYGSQLSIITELMQRSAGKATEGNAVPTIAWL
jgi:hypothetical protein